MASRASKWVSLCVTQTIHHLIGLYIRSLAMYIYYNILLNLHIQDGIQSYKNFEIKKEVGIAIKGRKQVAIQLEMVIIHQPALVTVISSQMYIATVITFSSISILTFAGVFAYY